jgi:peptidoglycan hydrolase-like protein with peptidoglycan-binding domain
MRHRKFTRYSRLLLSSAVAAVALTTGLLALPASGGPLATALDVPGFAAAPVEASQASDCPPTISRGARGDTVEYLQHLLNEFMVTDIATDGVFGGETESAVRRFQRRAGMRVDGVVGPLTWSALLAC